MQPILGIIINDGVILLLIGQTPDILKLASRQGYVFLLGVAGCRHCNGHE